MWGQPHLDIDPIVILAASEGLAGRVALVGLDLVRDRCSAAGV
jgi:hypothetical protein